MRHERPSRIFLRVFFPDRLPCWHTMDSKHLPCPSITLHAQEALPSWRMPGPLSFCSLLIKLRQSSPIKAVSPKGNQPWIFTGRTEAEAVDLILWPSDSKSRLIGKDLDAGKDGRPKEKGTAEDEMVREHHQLNGHELEQTPGDSEGQQSLLQRVRQDLAIEQ